MVINIFLITKLKYTTHDITMTHGFMIYTHLVSSTYTRCFKYRTGQRIKKID
jgi:hypothetical protein